MHQELNNSQAVVTRDGSPNNHNPTSSNRPAVFDEKTLQDHNGHSNGRNQNGSNGNTGNGHSSNGHSTNGHSTNGRSTNGHSTNGHSTNGHAANDQATRNAQTTTNGHKGSSEHSKYDEALQYWQRKLDGSQPAELLRDKPRPSSPTGTTAEHTFVDATVLPDLQAFCQVELVSPAVVLLSAFRAAHYRLTGVEDANIGLLHQSKGSATAAEMQCIRLTLEDGKDSFLSLIGKTAASTEEAAAHRGVSLERIVSATQRGHRKTAQNPLVRMAISVQSQKGNSQFEGDSLYTSKAREMMGLDVYFRLALETDGSLRGSVLYSNEIFDASSIQCLSNVFIEILRRGTTDTEMPLVSMPLTDGIQSLIDTGLAGIAHSEYPRESSVPALFREQVALSANTIAVKDSSTQLTYRQLDQQSDRIASWLLKQECFAPESMIGVFAPRSCETTAVFLGILKANLAYLPLDMNAPRKRLESIMSAVQGRRLVLLGKGIVPPTLDLEVEFLPIAEAQDPETNAAQFPTVSATNLAYVMFTSGSTGRPKGVMIEHRGIVRLVRNTNIMSAAQSAVAIAHISNLAFDAATWEIYASLLNGGTLVCLDHVSVLDLPTLGQTFTRDKIRAALFTPAFLKQCLVDYPTIVSNLDVLVVSGDRLDDRDALAAQRIVSGTVINACGHTENSCLSTLFAMTATEHCANGAPIGRSISNSGALVMDSQQRLVSPGVVGELVLAGDGVARGYTDSSLNAGRFIEVTVNGQSFRVYRTGDRVRIRPHDGQLEFFGRTDYQVKIRGHRVELPEVEQAFLRESSVADAAVITRAPGSVETELIAFVTMQSDKGVNGAAKVPTIDEKHQNVQQDQVEAWADLFDSDTYASIGSIYKANLGRDFMGWKSMYDGQLIERGEMNEWLDDTMMAIRSTGHTRNICEIGTGTGMMLFNLADDFEHYVGVDPSASAVSFVRRMAASVPGLANRINVQVGTAETIEHLDWRGTTPELVVINSVAQYFGSSDYLLATVERILKLESVECIFFGDVRSFALYDEFGTTKALRELGTSATVDGIRESLADLRDAEEELLIDPGFFTSLIDRLPDRVEHVRILPKRMAATNELSCYRYAAVIYAKRCTVPSSHCHVQEVAEVEWIDFETKQLDRPKLLHLLKTAASSSRVAVANIPNSKTMAERYVVDAVRDRDAALASESKVPDWLVTVQKHAKTLPSLSANDLTKVAEEAGWRVELSWARQHSLRGGLDAVFYQLGNQQQESFFQFPTDHRGRELSTLTNHPLLRQKHQQMEVHLRQKLHATLPSYMVPSRIVFLDTMPVNLNGKVDRRALSELALGANAVSRGPRDVAAPRNAVEEAICDEFTQVLGVDVGIQDNFFHLGGHSLMATRFVSRINRRLNIHITIREVFTYPGVAQLAEVIAQLLGTSTFVPIPRTQASSGPIEQSFAQGRLWFMDRLYPKLKWYLMPIAIHLRGELKLEALSAALMMLEQRHETLRTTFKNHGDVDLQIIHPFVPRQVRVVRVSGAEAEKALYEEQSRGFNLEIEPGWRTLILKIDETHHILSLVMHHIVSDAWSVNVLQTELSTLYAAALFSQDSFASALSPLPIHYRDFSIWQKQKTQTDEYERQLEYWSQQLDGSQPAEFLCDFPRPSLPAGTAREHPVIIEGSLFQDLQVFCKLFQVTPFAVLLAAFRATHFRLTGAEDATIGVPSANRNRPELEQLVGFFVNLQCIRLAIDEDAQDSFASLIHQAASTTAAASAHQDVPFEQIVAATRQGGQRDISRNPLVQVIFAVHSQHSIGHLQLPGIEAEPMDSLKASRFDLEFHLFQEEHRLRGSILFSDELFDLSSINCMTSVFFEILRRGLAAPEAPLVSTPLTDGLDVLDGMGFSRVAVTEYPRNSSVTDLFRLQVSQSGSAVAVKDYSSQLTYAELDKQSDYTAQWLLRQNLAPETAIGVLAPRSCETIVAFLGILKANMAYLPLDTNAPIGRLETVMSAIKGNRIILVGRDTTFPSMTNLTDIKHVKISETEDNITSSVALPPVSPTSLAYIMFTSGSTGQPKGVMIEHRGIVRLVKDTNIASASQTAGSIAHVSNLAFDAATWEIYSALLNGGCLICIDRLSVLDLPALAATFRNERIQAAVLTPAFVKQCLVECKQILTGLTLLFVAGDRVEAADASALLRLCGSECDVLNAYGPTENTTFSTVYHMQKRDANINGVPIGQTVSNSGTIIMDAKQSLVPVGVMGEVVLIGDGLARGYSDPALNKDRFIQINTLGQSTRAYRTGDRARRRPTDGQIEFFGRKDHQVKIRGHRIELAEVEQVLLRDSFVSDSVAVVRKLQSDELEIISFAALRRDGEHQRADGDGEGVFIDGIRILPVAEYQHIENRLRGMLQMTLPTYMMPSRIILLDRMPINSNGKVDRRKLSSLALDPISVSRGARTIVAPRNDVEKTICEQFTHVLGGTEVGITDNFFDLGGHSLMATRAVSRINQSLDTSITIREIFMHPNVTDLAEVVEHLLGTSTFVPIPRIESDDTVEQSFAQGRLWFIDRLYPKSKWYLMPFAVHLRGPLHLDALQAALMALEERHEPLRTTFAHKDGKDLQIIQPFIPTKRVVDMVGAGWDAVQQALQEEQSKPFDLETEPGWRTLVLRLADDDHILSIVMHHIVSDAWSVNILQQELSAFYSAALRGQATAAAVSPLPIQYRDFAAWQKQDAQLAEYERQLNYWRGQLDGNQPAELLCDRPRPSIPSGTAREQQVIIEGTLFDNLQLFCKRFQATPFTVLLAAFRATHFRLTGVEDATLGVPVANRNRQELESLIGFFVNLQCIRLTVSEEEHESFGSLVRQAVATTAAASAHQDVPFEKIVAAVQRGRRDLSRNPLAQIVFAVHSQQNIGDLEIEGVSSQPVSGSLEVNTSVEGTKTSRFDLEFHLFQEEQRFQGSVLFSDELFESSSIRSLISTYFEVLRRGLEEPDMPLTLMPLTDDLAALNNMGLASVARTNYPRDSSVTALFREQVAISGDAVALKDSGGQMSYRELDEHSDRIAGWLVRQNFAPETMIAVLAPRSCEAISAFLGILKADLAYLPLDINAPLGRTESILQTVEGKRLLLLGEGVPVPVTSLDNIEFLSISEAQDVDVDVSTLPSPSPNTLAYAMFTSGSTGRPKGVLVEHRGIVRLVKDTNVASKSEASVPIAHIANLAFDAATWEIYAALLNGGSLVCLDQMTVLDPASLGRAFIEHNIGAVYFAPSLLKQVLMDEPRALANLGVLVVGGEVLRPEDAISAKRAIAGVIYNCYGNTENTGFTAIYSCQTDDYNVNGVPIGRTISNSGVLVMNAQQEIVPLGIMGEIVLIGDGVARGYSDTGLNKNRFVQVTVNGESLKAYRTGDRGRYRPADGQLEFFGRKDYQVKIRGNRIELAEVEQCLLRDVSVGDAIALVRTTDDGEQEMVAFVVMLPAGQDCQETTNGAVAPQNTEDRLRSALQMTLPSYMIPKRIIFLDKMPINQNGKVDRRALGALVLGPAVSRGPRTVVPPRNDLERAICEEFSCVLEMDVGITDNFFDLGGHSLMATRLVSRINKRLAAGSGIILRDLYQYSTPEALCNNYSSREEKNIASSQPSSSFIEVHTRPDSCASLVLVHGFWGSGTVFSHLISCIPSSFDVYIVHDPFFGTGNGPETISEWATLYAKAVKARMPSSSRPVVLGGYSLGGLIAFEMASQWQESYVDDLLSVLLLDPAIFDASSADALDAQALDKEINYGVRLLGLDQESDVKAHVKKLHPLFKSIGQRPDYHGPGLYVSTEESAQAGISTWWTTNYPQLETHHARTAHYNLLDKSGVQSLSSVLDAHLRSAVECLSVGGPIDINHRHTMKTIDMSHGSTEEIAAQIKNVLIEVSNGIAASPRCR
ncbi:hypothetical protein NLG97_g5492 [Lecanicillium saksenae]|uniref:Uncharacterized protein n=1 Tax=Lecanicillium saksenae TaxID=468837 RepID=A0ACC1QU74_9HYPO|nr:hypothetical protein NLG97_g5492 [Lecanicillium saksenae]